MKFNTATVRSLSGAALIVVGTFAGLPVMAQTTTVPSTGTASPAARDGMGHAADSTAHSAHNKGMASSPSSSSSSSSSMSGSSGTGMTAGSARSNNTPMNTTPGAGLRNSGDATPPTSGAAGR
jgi:hypothetical protein